MKITKIEAVSRKDILRQRDEYDAETKKYQDKVDEGEKTWKNTLRIQEKAIEKQISDIIGPTSIELSIRVDPWANFDKGWGIDIKANEGKKWNDDVALSWNWDVKLDRDGEVVKDSGSWSGLKAITPAQISDLEESVRILKILNNIDWKSILNSPRAEWEDYVSKEDNKIARQRHKDRPNFENDLEGATLEEAIGTNIAFQLDSDQYFKGTVGILVTGLTDKFVRGYIFPWYWIESKTKDQILDQVREPRRTSRDHLMHDGGELVTAELK